MTQSSSLSPHYSPLLIEPELVTIPAGDFLMGSEAGQENEQPVHRVWVSAFALAKYPVTNREYACFLRAAGHGVPESWMSYLAVDDVDARVKKAQSAGATLMRPVFDVPNVGRIAILKEPGGVGIGWMTPAKV